MRLWTSLAACVLLVGCFSGRLVVQQPPEGPRTLLDEGGDTSRRAADLIGLSWNVTQDEVFIIAYVNGIPDVAPDLDYAGGMTYRPVDCPECQENRTYHWSFGYYKLMVRGQPGYTKEFGARVWSPEVGNESAQPVHLLQGSGVQGTTLVFRMLRPDFAPAGRLQVSNVDFGSRKTTDDPAETVPCYYDHVTQIPDWSQPMC